MNTKALQPMFDTFHELAMANEMQRRKRELDAATRCALAQVLGETAAFFARGTMLLPAEEAGKSFADSMRFTTAAGLVASGMSLDKVGEFLAATK